MTTVAVLDTETTGMDKSDRVCEIAVITLEVETSQVGERVYHLPRVTDMWHSLVRSGVPVRPGARATHHITDQELETAPLMTELIAQEQLERLFDADVVAAHNLEFDLRLLQQSLPPGVSYSPDRRICTYQCAKHLFSDQDSYSNQALRYGLGLQLPEDVSPPHRALPDALVTGLLLARMLGSHSVEDLERLTAAPALLARCPVGKHRGKPWSEVDSGMLQWILGKDFDADVKYTARHHLEKRRANGGND